MCTGNKHVLNKIFIPCAASFGSFTSSALCTVFSDVGSLDITQVGYGHDHIFIRNHVYNADFSVCKSDFSAAGITVFFSDIVQLLFDDTSSSVFVCKNILQIINRIDEIIILFFDFQSFKANKALQPHLQDRFSLQIRQGKLLH